MKYINYYEKKYISSLFRTKYTKKKFFVVETERLIDHIGSEKSPKKNTAVRNFGQ